MLDPSTLIGAPDTASVWAHAHMDNSAESATAQVRRAIMAAE